MDEFLNFSINWKTGELISENQSSLLEPKLVAVLKLLIEANGELVTYEEIQQSVWPHVVVAPNALQRIIAKLRRHLNDSAKTQQIIKTHPKRGYSLVLSLNEVEKNETKREQNLDVDKIPNRAFVFLSIGLFILLVLLWLNMSEQHSPVIKLQPLDSQSKQFSNVVPISEHTFVFLDKQNDAHQLVLHDSTSNKREVLVNKLNLYGDIDYSTQTNSLLYGRIVVNNGVKCAQLARYSFVTYKETLLLPCLKNFNHSAVELSPTALLFAKTDKNGVTLLHLLNTTTAEVIAVDSPTIVQLKHFSGSDNYAVQIDKQLYLAKINDRKLVFEEPVFQFSSNKPYPFVWLDKETLLLAEGKKVSWLNKTGVFASQSLATTMDIAELSIFENKIFAKFSRENWQTRLRNLTPPASDNDIATSIFNDHFAMFRPKSNDISLLSRRSGHAQIWLSTNDMMQQLTLVNKDVSSYLWQDSQNLIFLRAGQLFTLELNKDNTSIEKVIQNSLTGLRLYQFVDGKLLLKAKIDEQIHLGLLSITDGHFQSLYLGDVDWAQLTANNTLLLNTSSQIMKLQDQQLQPVEELADIILQWRYFSRGNALYFQDKKQNIWRYDTKVASKTKIGKFGIGSLFMTDFSIERNAMLSDNFIAELNELVELTIQ